MLSCAPSAPSMEHSAVRADALARMRSQACMQRADAFAEACMRKHARSPALPPLQCALRPALLRSHVLRRQGHTEHAKFQFCEASRYDLRECSGNSARSREKLCFGNNTRRGCDLKNRNHMLWGSPARLSYASGPKSRDMGCSYASGTTRRRDMRDVVAPYVICTILTVGNTGGANPDPRYASGTPLPRNTLVVKNSYARPRIPLRPHSLRCACPTNHRFVACAPPAPIP